MEINTPQLQPRPRKKRIGAVFAIFVVATLLSVTFAALIWYWNQLPNETRVDPFPEREGEGIPLVFQGEVISDIARLKEGQLFLKLSWMQQEIDPHIYWDEPTQSVVITTGDRILQMKNEQLNAYVNGESGKLKFPVFQEEGEVFVPFEPLDKLYPFEADIVAGERAVLLKQLDYPTQTGELKSDDEENPAVMIRKDADKKQPIVAEARAGDRVEIYGEKADWYQVLTNDGIPGYVHKMSVVLSGIQMKKWQPETARPAAWKPIGERLNVTWEHVYSRNPDTNKIPDMPGVHVVSPTWFAVEDESGQLSNKADMGYVRWAHDRGYQVWALFSNNFDPDLTRAVLADFETRDNMIRQLVQFAALYELDGINIDFENVYLEDKERLVQFVRELTPYLHEQGLVVSMDVTIKSLSERWSLFYDRKALAEVVDYMMVMTYDEHWASSPKAGSVASLPWVEKGLKGVLEEVPRDKLLLGIPFYTRLWTETRQADGTVQVTSKALSMPAIESWLKEKGAEPVYDEQSGQMFAEVKESDQITYKVWLENEVSLKKRVELVKKYDLAGIASWRRGFERPDIWPYIDEEMKKRP